MKLPQRILFLAIVGLLNKHGAFAALSQAQEYDYLANFDAMQAASYSVLQDANKLPPDLITVCKNDGIAPTYNVTVQPGVDGYVTSSQVSQQCGNDSICIIPFGTTFQLDESINLAALTVKGNVEWTDATQLDSRAFLCAGYVSVEGHGKWDMNLQQKDGFVYLKDNGAIHHHLRTRAFGSYAMTSSDYPVIDITGRELVRTWSLLSNPLKKGEDFIRLMHNPNLMGWRVGDRIAISPTEVRATGHGEDFTIVDIEYDGTLKLSKIAEYDHDAAFKYGANSPALLSSEVINLSRNIVITGDDFKHVDCDSSLPEAVPGEQTSTEGCRCASFRTKCTMGLHTAIMHGGEARITNTRIEKCGQRGVEGKYCLHLHKLSDCPNCLFKNNAIENSHQRGIIVHSTHLSVVEQNVLYNVRGAGIYLEDGNELWNQIKYNIVVCPFPFGDNILHGCTVPGTSNRIADTSDNQSGIFSRGSTNGLTGNRVSNSFNGMFFNAGGIGRGDSYNKVCEADALIGRIEGNTFHGNGRFGTYFLGGNFPKSTDQSLLTNGWNVDQSLCSGFDDQGYTRGRAGVIVDNVDYHNAFVGQYEAGDIQYSGHHSYNSIELMYWKVTKGFDNGCSAHITGSSYETGNLALPDQSTFIIEHSTFGNSVSFEANHHCDVGTTGVLCFPQYIFHNIEWKNTDVSKRWIWFQSGNTNYGGVFTLSPPNAETVMSGQALETSIFPPGYVSLVSNKYVYLLNLPNNICALSRSINSSIERLYPDGILCKIPLRPLKIYSRGLSSDSAPNLQVEFWYNQGGVESQTGSSTSSQIIEFHEIASKQGYSFPVIPGKEHSYRLSLTTANGTIPSDWVIEFSDVIVGNRFGSVEYTNLSLNGILCGSDGLVSSHHDRRYMWSGDQYMSSEAWGNTGACAAGKPPDNQMIDCNLIDKGVLPALKCSELCDNKCNEANSFCDCGSESCICKPGFYGEDCSADLCTAARCEHGACTATYLGGELPVTKNACVCEDGWSGSRCQFNPCLTLNKQCVHGYCRAISDTEAACVCDKGFSGEECTESCDGICNGSYPYGCATNINEVVRYGCHPGGGCNYLKEGQNYPYSGFCTYKEVEQNGDCVCGEENECELSRLCSHDGSCSFGQFLPDGSPCNTVPSGTCQSGVCTDTSSARPTKNPTSEASRSPSRSSTEGPTDSPFLSPTKAPSKISTSTNAPAQQPKSCADINSQQDCITSDNDCRWRISFEVCVEKGSKANKAAKRSKTTSPTTISASPKPTDICDGLCNGSYPYGCATSLNDVVRYGCHSGGGCNYLKEGEEYPYGGFCTYKDDSPSESSSRPTKSPSLRPNGSITSNPTSNDSSPKPTDICDGLCIGSYPYGCATSLNDVVRYGCHSGGGCNYLKEGEEYPYGGFCTYKDDSPSESSSHPTQYPSQSPIKSPPPSPDSSSSYCGCPKCNDYIWNTSASDGAGDYTCGERIIWLQTSEGGSLTETEACSRVSGVDFPSGPCGPSCDPARCNLVLEDPDPATLIFSDEFDLDGSPDPTKWDYDLGDGCSIGLCNWGNNEVAYYTNRPSNVYVDSGSLKIVAKKETGFSLPYTSARIVTRGKHIFKYGRVQFRANLSKCKAVGTWPALWMLPEYRVYGGRPRSGEIDIMETVGHDTNKFHGTVHTEAYNGMIGTQQGSSISLSKDEWHVFEVDWKETAIQFAVDKQVYFEFPRGDSINVWPFDQEFHLVMNVAVGGNWGGQQGIDSAAFEGSGQTMEIDYVRVYGEAPSNVSPTAPPTNPPIHCGCSACTQSVWNAPATDGGGTYTCGARIDWLKSPNGGSMSEFDACRRVAGVEFPNGPCGPMCDPSRC